MYHNNELWQRSYEETAALLLHYYVDFSKKDRPRKINNSHLLDCLNKSVDLPNKSMRELGNLLALDKLRQQAEKSQQIFNDNRRLQDSEKKLKDLDLKLAYLNEKYHFLAICVRKKKKTLHQKMCASLLQRVIKKRRLKASFARRMRFGFFKNAASRKTAQNTLGTYTK